MEQCLVWCFSSFQSLLGQKKLLLSLRSISKVFILVEKCGLLIYRWDKELCQEKGQP